MTEFRIVPCDVCGTEGRIYEACTIYDRDAGGHIPDQRDIGPCAECEGTGGMLIEVEPIELEDLDTE